MDMNKGYKRRGVIRNAGLSLPFVSSLLKRASRGDLVIVRDGGIVGMSEFER